MASRVALSLCVCVALAPSMARADRVVLETQWEALQMDGASTAGAIVEVPSRGLAALRVTPTDGESTVVLTLDDPPLDGPVFELRGLVRTSGVSPPGDLLMWVEYERGERLASRTAGTSGPQAVLEGDTDFRPFALPFVGAEGRRVRQLRLEVLLPGEGRVDLGPVRLVVLDQAGVGSRLEAPWWAEGEGPKIGASIGIAIGLLGAFATVLALFGGGRGLGLLALRLMLVVGGGSLAAGLTGLGLLQPWDVYFPLLSAGSLGLVCTAVVYGPLRRRFDRIRESELPRLG